MSTKASLPDQEMRYWPTHLEARSQGMLRRIGGLGVPYGQRSRLLPGGFCEIVEGPKAIAKSLGDKLNICCRMEHHPEWLLATTESGTLRLNNEERGLSYEADLPDTSAGRDCYELVKTGRMPYSSMGFRCMGDEFRRDGSVLVRHLTAIMLTEVSPVAQPAYCNTTTAVRSLALQVGEDPADVEALAAQGELRALFTRTDQHVVATPTVLPGERRSDPGAAEGELELRRRRNALRARECGYDPADPGQRLLEHYRRKLQWKAPVSEARSNPYYRVS